MASFRRLARDVVIIVSLLSLGYFLLPPVQYQKEDVVYLNNLFFFSMTLIGAGVGYLIRSIIVYATKEGREEAYQREIR